MILFLMTACSLFVSHAVVTGYYFSQYDWSSSLFGFGWSFAICGTTLTVIAVTADHQFGHISWKWISASDSKLERGISLAGGMLIPQTLLMLINLTIVDVYVQAFL